MGPFISIIHLHPLNHAYDPACIGWTASAGARQLKNFQPFSPVRLEMVAFKGILFDVPLGQDMFVGYTISEVTSLPSGEQYKCSLLEVRKFNTELVGPHDFMNRAEAAQMNIDLDRGEIDKINAKSKSQGMQPPQRANQNNTAGHGH